MNSRLQFKKFFPTSANFFNSMEICDSQNSVIFYDMTDVFEWGNTPMLPNAAPNTEEYTAWDWALGRLYFQMLYNTNS